MNTPSKSCKTWYFQTFLYQTDPNSAPKALKGQDNFVVTSESTHASLFDDIHTEGGSNMVGKISRTPDREDFWQAHLEDVAVLRHGFKTRQLLSSNPARKSMPLLPPAKYSAVRNLAEMIKGEGKVVPVHSWSLASILHNKTDDQNNKWNQEMLQGKQEFAVL